MAVRLAEQLDGEIISMDSRQCYKQIDIGTAKPTPDQLRRVPHHNISILDITEKDSAAEFDSRVRTFAEETEQRGRTAIFCGGSTLHLQSLIQPLDDIPSSNPAHLASLTQKAEDGGLESLYRKLQEVDPDYARSMDGMNRQRIIRALDVWMQTGKPFSSFHHQKKPAPPRHYSIFLLHHPRKILHQRINRRTDQMIADGLLDETRELVKRYPPELQALQTVGYRQAIQHLNGEISEDQMVKDIKTATRRYAKRQITWFRRWDFARWIDMAQYDEAAAVHYIQQQVAADNEKG